MRTRFHEDLEQLADQLHMMCLCDRAAIAAATDGLLDADLEQCERAIEICQKLDTLRDQCEHTAVALLALQSPVASELRKVVTAIQLVSNLHRMGALTEHIANIARRRHPEHAVPASMAPIMARMGAAAVAMATAAAAVLVSGDPDDA
ncbi:phosphate signaling complex PhoU family protein, partial [Nocardia salmonicida]